MRILSGIEESLVHQVRFFYIMYRVQCCYCCGVAFTLIQITLYYVTLYYNYTNHETGMQWISVGSGIEHAEGGGTPEGMKNCGFQIWVNVPSDRKMVRETVNSFIIVYFNIIWLYWYILHRNIHVIM